MRLQRAARLEALLAVSARKRPRVAAVRQAVIQQVLDTTFLRCAAVGVTTVNIGSYLYAHADPKCYGSYAV